MKKHARVEMGWTDGLETFEELFDANNWGLRMSDEKWYGLHPRMPPPPPTPPIGPGNLTDERFRTVAGPMAVFIGISLSVCANYSFGSQIGDVACRWRVSYSPSGRAFGIWALIYTWNLVSCVYQLSNALCECTYASLPWTNLLIAGAWGFCGLWVCIFGDIKNRLNPQLGLVVSTLVIVAATMLAVGAAMLERGWQQPRADRILLVQIPVSLFAGWLLAATSISFGTTVLSLSTEPSLRCSRRASYWTFNRETYEDSSSCASFVPITLAVAVSMLAMIIPDPVLPIPLVWAIVNMRGHVKNWAAILLLLAVSGFVFVRWWLEFL